VIALALEYSSLYLIIDNLYFTTYGIIMPMLMCVMFACQTVLVLCYSVLSCVSACWLLGSSHTVSVRYETVAASLCVPHQISKTKRIHFADRQPDRLTNGQTSCQMVRHISRLRLPDRERRG